jgi:competence ComEA-like helix-hairpin-helix protein
MAERSGQKTRNGKGDLNRAGRDELTAIPGIGPATAEAILKRREQRGAFESLDQLGDVAGLGTQAAKNLRKRFTVSGKRAGSGGRSAGGVAKRAAESARQAGENAGETTRRAGEKGAQTAREIGEPGANVAAEAGRSSVAEAKAASEATADTFRSSRREAGTGSKETIQQAQKDAEPLAASTDGVLESMQELQREWLSCVQAQLEDTLAAGQDLARCRSPKDLIDVQLRYTRASMERFVTQSAKLAGLAARMAGTGLHPLQAAMSRGTAKPGGPTRS